MPPTPPLFAATGNCSPENTAQTPCDSAAYEAANIIRTTINPMTVDHFLNNLSIHRVPLAPLTQHRSATTLRSPSHLTSYPYTSPCPLPRNELNYRHAQDTSVTKTIQCHSPLRNLSNSSPHRSVMSPNSSLHHPSPHHPKNNESSQWVILDGSFERSSSPDVLHLCATCDEEFNTINQLRQHSLNCGVVKVKPPTKKRQQKKQSNQQRKRIQNKQILRPRPQLTTPNPVVNQFIPLPVTPKRQSVLKKETFLHSLGLGEPSSTLLKAPTNEPKSIPKRPSTSFRNVPFTHLPENFRLRNISFYPSLRTESLNQDLININWKRVDTFCPAYPEGHKRYVNFVLVKPPAEHSKAKTVLGSQALALKRSLIQPSLIARRLSAHEIKLAALGINTQELLKEKPLRKISRGRSRPRSRKPVPASIQPDPASKKKKRAQSTKSTAVIRPTSSVVSKKQIRIPSYMSPIVKLKRMSQAEITSFTSRSIHETPAVSETPSVGSSTSLWYEEDGVIVIDD